MLRNFLISTVAAGCFLSIPFSAYAQSMPQSMPPFVSSTAALSSSSPSAPFALTVPSGSVNVASPEFLSGDFTATGVPPLTECAEPADILLDDSKQPVSRFRKQAIQKVSVSAGWMAATSDDDLSSSYFETSISLGVPLGNFENILGVTPTFRADFIDAAPEYDVPAELYETGVSFFYRRPLHDRWSTMAIVRPSVRSDFTTGDNAFRLFGLALLNWQCRPDELMLSFGAVYLDRADLPLLPAVGLTWTPRTTVRLDLQFPRSKLSWRLAKDGCRSETWSYLSAGIGGNTWAVTRASGLSDELSLRDLRLTLGVDHVTDGGGGWFAECALALNRHIEYESMQSEVDLSNGIMLQGGWRF